MICKISEDVFDRTVLVVFSLEKLCRMNNHATYSDIQINNKSTFKKTIFTRFQTINYVPTYNK